MQAPKVTSEFYNEKGGTISFVVPPDLACFDGHFPGNPLLPGYLLLTWTLSWVNRVDGLCSKEIEGFRIPSCKFLSVIRPKDELIASIVLQDEKSRVLFEVSENSEEGELKCKGSLWFE